MSERNLIHKGGRALGQTGFGAWLGANMLYALDRWWMRLSNGRSSLTAILTGLPIITITTTGAKSGQPRTQPLVGIPNGDKLVIIASNFGQKRNPAWYYNLRANPQATVVINGRSQTMLARETDGAEREQYWETAVATYVGYALYKKKASHRKIPVLLLTPV
ncbi:MAG: nitroreductase family deazaflavin-dependent oxidoreductase [Chloroflexota bacterium]